MSRDLARAGVAALVVLAALMAFHRVFTTASWQPAAVAAALVALAIAAAGHRARLQPAAVLVAEAVGLVVFAAAVHLGGTPLLERARALVDLAGTGLQQFRDQPAPTPPLEGLRLLVTTGAWAAAWASHELLVRRDGPLVALAPPALLWSIPLVVPQPPGRTWPHTLPLLAAAGLLLLLESDTGVEGRVGQRSRRIAPAGVALGLGALAVAGLAPGLLPGYGDPPWLDRAAGSPRGYQPIVDVGDRLRLPEPRDLLEVTADRRVYLRLAALDSFDGVTWRLGPPGSTSFVPERSQLFDTGGALPPEVPIGASQEVVVDVRVRDLENIYVPTPYQPVRVTGPGADRIVYSRTGGFLATGELTDNPRGGSLEVGVREGFRYGVTAEIPTPAYEDLAPVRIDPEDPRVAPYLQLPRRYDALRAQAEQLYTEAGAVRPVDKALALQHWFVGPGSPFTYSTEVPELRGGGALEQFVLEQRTGYCEYFATAMAVMLRSTGVPARVAVGFLPGTSSPATTDGRGPQRFTVSTEDAHAWVEVLFPGHGWVRFEPTPRADGATMTPVAADLDPDQPDRERDAAEAAAPAEPTPEPTTGADDGAEEAGETPAEQAQDAPAEQVPGTPGSLPAWLVAVVLGAIVVTGALAALALRSRPGVRGGGPAERVLAAQDRLLAHARRLGVGRRPSETAVEVTRRWSEEERVPPARAARLARLCQAAAFGHGVTAGEAAEAEELAAEVAAALRDSVTARERALAPVRVPLEAVSGTARELTGRLRTLIRP